MSEIPRPVIVAHDLTRRFRSTLAVDRVAFEIRPAEIFAVVGADGSGKTTLLQMLAAILDPTAGRAEVLGYDSVREARQITARIGYMSQGFTLYERLTVEENLAFAATVRGVAADDLSRRRERLLRMAGLDRFTTRRAGDLSGGMKKKLALCTNLIHEPPVLLLDEPSLGVDPLSRRELWELLEDFRRQGAAIVLATSYMEEADRCDRLIFLHEGRSLALGVPAELKAGIAGKVFEIPTHDPADAERRLVTLGAVAGIARLPGKVRFQLRQSSVTGPSESLESVPDAQQVAPRLEDLFVTGAPGEPAQVAPIDPVGTLAPRVASGASTDAERVTVRTRGVICRFGDFTAVNDVSFELTAGQVFGFLGPNGAGKTTLIRILCGLQRFDAGVVEVAGLDVRRNANALRRRIGYMSQKFSLYPDLTVMENLEFFAGVYDLSSQARIEAISWAVRMAGLQGLGARRVSEISGAVRQRLALACSVMHRPQVLFLDEPTSGVDPISRQRFWRLVHALAGGGITVFVTTHYMEEAAYCDRLGLMFQGRLIALGSLAELKAREQLPEASGVEALFLHYMERAREAA